MFYYFINSKYLENLAIWNWMSDMYSKFLILNDHFRQLLISLSIFKVPELKLEEIKASNRV